MNFIALLLMLLLVQFVISEESKSKDSNYNATSKVLSRKKRFLIFPDGSSFQLVFCTQTHGYLQVGDIVWFGNTAALAWELPTDPDIFELFKNKDYLGPVRRRNGIVYYVDEDGRVIDKKEYKKKMIVNPAFAKRSVDAENQTVVSKNYIKEMHDNSRNKVVFKDLDSTRIQFHRDGRTELYPKLESLLQSLGWSGRECIQKLLCETGHDKKEKQGTFLGEITKAVFTLPKVQESDPDIKHYDDAHGTNGNCAELFPECGEINVL